MASLLRSCLVVVVAAIVPAFAACGARIGEDPENSESHPTDAAVTSANSDAAATTTTTSSAPCPSVSETSAFYRDARPPTPGAGSCLGLFDRAPHPDGCVITIVPPPGGPGCFHQSCVCENGTWEPSENPGCRF
jgi:hypothetical protein